MSSQSPLELRVFYKEGVPYPTAVNRSTKAIRALEYGCVVAEGLFVKIVGGLEGYGIADNAYWPGVEVPLPDAAYMAGDPSDAKPTVPDGVYVCDAGARVTALAVYFADGSVWRAEGELWPSK